MDLAAASSKYVSRGEFEALQREVAQLKQPKNTMKVRFGGCQDARCTPVPARTKGEHEEQNPTGKIIKIVAMILVCVASFHKDHKAFVAGAAIAAGSHLTGFKTSQKLAETGSLRGCNGVISLIFDVNMQSEIEFVFEITVLCSHILGHHHHGIVGQVLDKAYPSYIGLFAGLKLMHLLKP